MQNMGKQTEMREFQVFEKTWKVCIALTFVIGNPLTFEQSKKDHLLRSPVCPLHMQ